MTFDSTLTSALEISECIRIAVRAQNPTGLVSTATAPLDGCTFETLTADLIVIDAVGERMDPELPELR